MKYLGIKSIVIKKYKPYKSKNKVYDKGENLLNRDFSTTKNKWKMGSWYYLYTFYKRWMDLLSIDLRFAYSKNSRI